jgi:hypothetical protein
MTLLQTLNDTTFSQKNADNIQKYVKKARKKVHYINACISMKYNFGMESMWMFPGTRVKQYLE